MGVLFGDGVANFVVVSCSVMLMAKKSVASQLLQGLRLYQARAASPESKEPRPEGVSGKQAKKQAKAAARQSVYVEGAEEIVRVSMPSKSFLKAHYMEDFDALVNGAVLLLGNAIVVASPLLGYRLASYTWLIWMGCLVPFLVGFALSKVEAFTKGVSNQDRRLIVGFSIALSLVSGLLLEFLPSNFLDFQSKEAAAELSGILTSLPKRLDMSVSTFSPVIVPEYILKGFVAVIAGVFSSLLTPAAMRVGKCLVLASEPPHATRQYLGFGTLKMATMQLAIALPCIGALFWVRPMAQDLFHLSDWSVRLGRAAFLLILAVVHAAAARPFVQAYLNSSLVIWWTQKHAMTSWDKKSQMGEWIRIRVDSINILVCKVAVEVAAPSVLWLSCAALLLFTIFKDSNYREGRNELGYPWNMVYKLPSEGAWVPNALLSCVWGFVAWWTCLWWTISTAITIAMLRKGLLAGS